MAEPIDINHANAEELQRALQVSEECARKILDRREQLGGFSSWEQIKQVAGIDDGTLASLMDGGFVRMDTGTPLPRAKYG